MTTHGRIPDEWIVSYASGALSDAKSLLVATHLSYHPELQEKLADAEDMGGALLDDCSPEEMGADALQQVLSQLDGLPETTTSASTDAAPKAHRIPEPLANALGGDLDDLKWRFMGPGMKQYKIWKNSDGECLWLLRARGGTQIPVHDHRSPEYTLILEGSYSVNGKRFGPGDMEIADADLKNHQPVIDEGEDCICLVVTEAPIKLHSLAGRLVQPFIGL